MKYIKFLALITGTVLAFAGCSVSVVGSPDDYDKITEDEVGDPGTGLPDVPPEEEGYSTLCKDFLKDVGGGIKSIVFSKDEYEGKVTDSWSGSESGDITVYYDSARGSVFVCGHGKRMLAPADCSKMFSGCSRLTSVDLSGLDTCCVTDMQRMFYHCYDLASVDLSSFNTSAVTDMQSMFEYCRSLTSLDVSSFNTSCVTDMQYMFAYCESLTSLDLTSFDTCCVTDMQYMFCDCKSLTGVDLSSFNTSAVTDMQRMFRECSKLSSVNTDDPKILAEFKKNKDR